MPTPTRRTFLKQSAVATASLAFLSNVCATPTPKIITKPTQPLIKKSLKFGMIKEDLSILDKFKLVKNLGFDGIELDSPNELTEKEILNARDKSGLEIPGTVNSFHWKMPLSDPDPTVRAKCVETETGVKIAIENVWNNFLISPLEAARYIDEFESPMIGWYFDVGNIVRYGWPAQWIQALGKRIIKIDIKDYSRKKQTQEGIWKGFKVKLIGFDYRKLLNGWIGYMRRFRKNLAMPKLEVLA